MRPRLSADLEAQIYNDLYRFFARYYDDGDFIALRRYGADNKYAIPYNGEEVILYWANFDQYYVKTGEYFTDYRFHRRARWPLSRRRCSSSWPAARRAEQRQGREALLRLWQRASRSRGTPRAAR